MRLFRQRLFEELLDFAFCTLYCWNPAVLFPPDIGCPNKFYCKVPVGPPEPESELELRLLKKKFGSLN